LIISKRINAAGNVAPISVIATKVFIMANELINSDETNVSEQNQPAALVLASATLHYQSDDTDHYFPINRLSSNTIGRSSANNIILDDNQLSRDHAMIRCSAAGVCELSDVGSRNGTRVNGTLISVPVALKDGDLIQVGQHALTFIQAQDALELMVEAGEDGAVSVFPPNSLITALSLNVRGYGHLEQVLGVDVLAALMADVAAIAGDILTRRGAWTHRHEGSAIHVVWAHPDDSLSARGLLNIFDAIAEIQIGVRPLQKKYHLLRPIGFGCGVTTGHALLENVGQASETDFGALCNVVQQAYRLENATRSTGCDVLIAESGLALLDPPLAKANLPDLCSVSSKGHAASECAYSLRFDQLGALSAAVAGSIAKVMGGSGR
jgi:adenylate cyclase